MIKSPNIRKIMLTINNRPILEKEMGDISQPWLAISAAKAISKIDTKRSGLLGNGFDQKGRSVERTIYKTA